MNHVKMDSEITRLVVEKKGKFAHSLLKAEKEERDYLRKIVFDNFDRIDPVELIYALEYSGIHVDKARV